MSMVFHMSQSPLLISMAIKPAHHQRKCTQHEINHHKSATAIGKSQSNSPLAIPGFFSSYIQMWELDHKEGWALKNWCFQIESPLDCKEIKPVDPKGIQPWMFTGRTPAEVESPLLWPLAVKSWLIGKDPDAGKDWRQEEKEIEEDEMIGWHHWLDGHEFEQALGDGGGQGSLMCYSCWGLKQLEMTEWLKWIEGMHMCYVYNIMIIWSLYIGHIDLCIYNAILVSGIIIHR